MAIGPWRVIRRIGAGAVGAVYEVRHAQLGSRMALKAFVFDGAESEFFRKRFMAEGRGCAIQASSGCTTWASRTRSHGS